MEGDAFGLHLLDAAVTRFFHFEIGNAIAQKATGFGVFFIKMNIMTGALNCRAAAMPAGPAKSIMSALLPVLWLGTRGVIQPSSQPLSTIAHSTD